MMIRVVGIVLLLCLLRSSLQAKSDDKDKKDDTESPIYFFGFFVNPYKPNQGSKADLKLILVNTDSEPVSFTMVAPGIDYANSGTIFPNEWNTVDIPSEAEVSSIDDQNKGIYLTATRNAVTVIGQSINGNYIDTFTLLPVANLNADKYTYYSITASYVHSDNSTILIVGTEDSTTMELIVTEEVQVKIGDNVNNLVPGNLYSFVINRFQTVYIATHIKGADLGGTKIVTDKPVSVLSGNGDGNNIDWPRGNYLVEQIPPSAYWDKVYYFASSGISDIRVIAAEDGTNVDIHCNGIKESHTINEGKSVEKTFTSAVEISYGAVHSDKPVLVAQMGTFLPSMGDPMMAMILGANQYTNRLDSSTLNPEDSSKQYYHYINLFVLAEYYQPIKIHLTQGGETQTLNNGKWEPIITDNFVKAYALQISIKPGPYSITHDNPAAKMTVMSFGTGDEFGGYGHSMQFRVAQVLPLCPVLEDIDNGSVECSLGSDGIPSEGDTCIYVCDEGFVVTGSSITRECQSDGSWSGSEPTCERVLCYQLEAPDNGKVECTGNQYEDVCTFLCDDGFELTGSDTRICQSDANWSGNEAECVPGSHQHGKRKHKKAGNHINKDRDYKQEL